MISSVSDSFNAVFVQGDIVGETMFYGRGAGMLPTASSVIGDIVDGAKDLLNEVGTSVSVKVMIQNKKINLIALEEVTDPRNIGSVIRSAVARTNNQTEDCFLTIDIMSTVR